MSHLYSQAVKQAMEDGIYRTLPKLTLQGKYVVAEGHKMLNFCGNDYLGLAADPNLASIFPFEEYRMGASSSRLLTGNDKIYTQFEEELALAYGRNHTLLWDSGYHANSGLIPVLNIGNTLFLADRLVHASMIDGLRLARATFHRFRHNDVAHLEELLSKHAHLYDAVWILTESVFSMDGDVAPLLEILAVKEQYPNTYIYVDEAHGVGVFGNSGLGVTEELGIQHKVDVIVGTLGKAIGSVGAYTVLPEPLYQLAISKARPLIYSTALPPVCVAWSRHVFRYMQQAHQLRKHLQSLEEVVSSALGIQVSSPIIPIIIPGEDACKEVAEHLCREGFYIRPIRKPTVPAGTERIRISLSAAMTHQEVQQFCNILHSLR